MHVQRVTEGSHSVLAGKRRVQLQGQLLAARAVLGAAACALCAHSSATAHHPSSCACTRVHADTPSAGPDLNKKKNSPANNSKKYLLNAQTAQQVDYNALQCAGKNGWQMAGGAAGHGWCPGYGTDLALPWALDLSSPWSSALGACHPAASNPSLLSYNRQVKSQPVEATRLLLLKINI